MDLYKKLKQKITEEFDTETDDDGASSHVTGGVDPIDEDDGGGGSQEVLELRREVRTLKAHIQNNYNVYVKRLEKRKTRIKDLEEYSKLVVKDNETLTGQLQEAEGYKKQLVETRENLEQMEGFQNQELSKVKHMLLNAETVAETEKSLRSKLSEELDELQKQYDHLLNATSDVPIRNDQSIQTLHHQSEADLISKIRSEHESTVRRYEEQVQDLENRLEEAVQAKHAAIESSADPECESDGEKSDSKISGEIIELRSTLSRYDTSVIPELREKLKVCQQERDSAKNSLIEVEIAKHESENSWADREGELKMKLAQLTTEKETLEMTLKLRDNEIKSRKEENRGEREKSELEIQGVRREMLEQSEKIKAFQDEILSLNNQLTESCKSLDALTAQHQALMVNCAGLTEELESKKEALEGKDKHMDELHQRLDGLNRDFEDMVSMNHQLESNLCQVKDEFTRQSTELGDLKEAHTQILDMHSSSKAEVANLQQSIRESEESFPDRLESSDLVKQLRESNHEMSDELAEKKQSLKLLQQRMNDMKKTFQKELNTARPTVSRQDSRLAEDEESSQRTLGAKSVSASTLSAYPSGPASTAPSTTPIGSNGSVQPSSSVHSDAVDLTYLKHVIFKFLTSREYEAKQLTRAVATLLNFSRDEEKLLRDHLEWKTSWFGNLTTAKPDLGQGQFSLSLNPS